MQDIQRRILEMNMNKWILIAIILINLVIAAYNWDAVEKDILSYFVDPVVEVTK